MDNEKACASMLRQAVGWGIHFCKCCSGSKKRLNMSRSPLRSWIISFHVQMYYRMAGHAVSFDDTNLDLAGFSEFAGIDTRLQIA